ncbi:MAG: hypothetical protein GX050_09930 [Firmicutes bacterium]|nr:hypothetical protein [Bacillota bacterium]
MLGPLDVQVLVNRTLEVQKLQGNILQQQEDESEIQKNRRDNEIRKAEQQVRRKSETVQGRIQEGGREQQAPGRQAQKRKFAGKKEEKQSPPKQQEGKGRFIDLEV